MCTCYTTDLTNEEDPSPYVVTTQAVGEEGPTTLRVGEESFSSTMAVGEEVVVPCEEDETASADTPFGAF